MGDDNLNIVTQEGVEFAIALTCQKSKQMKTGIVGCTPLPLTFQNYSLVYTKLAKKDSPSQCLACYLTLSFHGTHLTCLPTLVKIC